jgi:phosphatidylinositol-3-phosphatase
MGHILSRNEPSDNPGTVQSTTQHFARQLENAGLSWKTYQEDISGSDCPLTDIGRYAVRHNPFVYFDDMTDAQSTSSAYCIAHVRPYEELTRDLQQNQVARYNFILRRSLG